MYLNMLGADLSSRQLDIARFIAAMIVLCCLWGSASAEIINRTMYNGLTASAEYYEGQDDMPVVMLLHGFLQTRDFPTVARLGVALRDEGYTVLIPTMTLNVDRRKMSLACEAIHTHSMQGDIREIGEWVDWLHDKTGRPLSLIGHSTGSTYALVKMEGLADPRIARIILISLLHFDENPMSPNTDLDFARARTQQQAGDAGLKEFSLSFCRKYPSESADYLSYREWTRARTLQALGRLKIPAYIIIGGKDKRMTENWKNALEATEAELVLVDEAGHFFDTSHEFDLLDHIISMIRN